MKRTWIFFKLRLLQLKSDKTALFFSYIFPVLLLIGIGLPMEMRGDHQAELYYEDLVANEQSQRLISYLEEHALIKFMIYKDKELTVFDAIEKNEVKHFLSPVIHVLSYPCKYYLECPAQQCAQGATLALCHPPPLRLEFRVE